VRKQLQCRERVLTESSRQYHIYPIANVATSAEVVVPDSERGILLEHYVLIETATELV
jgi:hypothetical protein